MFFLRHLTRPLRPASLHPAAILRTRPRAATTMTSEFFSPNSIHHIGLGHRFYSPARNSSSINTKVLYGIIGLNTAIFAYAQYVQAQAQQGFQQPLINFLQNMTLNLDGVLKEGKWWTMITSCFTHMSIMHLLGNLLSTYYLGGMLAHTPGITPAHFLTLILGSGITGSVGYLYLRHQKTSNSNSSWRGRQRDYARGLGFSGAVMGVGAVAAFLYPRAQMLIYGIVPMPLWALMLGYGIYDGYFLNDERAKVAHAGHLGGLAFGVFYYMARMRGLRL